MMNCLENRKACLDFTLIDLVHSLTCLYLSGWEHSKPEMSDSATVLEAFKFIEKAAAEFSDEDDDDDSEGQNKTIVDLATVS